MTTGFAIIKSNGIAKDPMIEHIPVMNPTSFKLRTVVANLLQHKLWERSPFVGVFAQDKIEGSTWWIKAWNSTGFSTDIDEFEQIILGYLDKVPLFRIQAFGQGYECVYFVYLTETHPETALDLLNVASVLST